MARLHEVLQPDDSSHVRVAGKAGIGIEVGDKELVHQDHQCLQCPWAGVVIGGGYGVDERHQHPLLFLGVGVEPVEKVGGIRFRFLRFPCSVSGGISLTGILRRNYIINII